MVFNELVEAEQNPHDGFNPTYMIDQSHNVTDPIESMISSAEAIASAYTKALIVNREELHGAQESNDTMAVFQSLRKAYNTDISPILAMIRIESGGAIDVLKVYRLSEWRQQKTSERQSVDLGAGIV